MQTKISAGGKALPTERAELMASPDLHAVGSRQLVGFSRRIARQMAAPCDCATQAEPGFHSATSKGNGRRRLIATARTANGDPPVETGREGAGHAFKSLCRQKRALANEYESEELWALACEAGPSWSAGPLLRFGQCWPRHLASALLNQLRSSLNQR